MFLMAIKKFTSTETHIIYGTCSIYRPEWYRTYISAVTRQACNMLHTGYDRLI